MEQETAAGSRQPGLQDGVKSQHGPSRPCAALRVTKPAEQKDGSTDLLQVFSGQGLHLHLVSVLSLLVVLSFACLKKK